MKTNLEYWNPKNKSVITKSGFRYLDTKSTITSIEAINYGNKIELFETFYRMNNSLRYCNGSYYKFQDKKIENQYQQWLKSDDYEQKSFNLFYGEGVVD